MGSRWPLKIGKGDSMVYKGEDKEAGFLALGVTWII